jgi:hypothetical protein
MQEHGHRHSVQFTQVDECREFFFDVDDGENRTRDPVGLGPPTMLNEALADSERGKPGTNRPNDKENHEEELLPRVFVLFQMTDTFSH